MTQDGIPERVSSLEENLNRYIDFSMQIQRNQQIQIDEMRRSQQAQIDLLSRNQINLTEAVHELAYAMREMQTEIRDIRADMREMQAEIRDIRAEIREIRADMQEMRLEIRGMQIEQGRILDVLLNQQQPPEAEP